MESAQHTYESLFRLAEPSLRVELVSPKSVAALRRVAELLPIKAINFFGVESRLGADHAASDCAFNLIPDGARMLAEQIPAKVMETPARTTWDKVRQFYRDWVATGVPERDDAKATWLEFDSTHDALEPNLLFAYSPDSAEGRRPFAWLLEQILPGLIGAPLSDAFESNVRACFDLHPCGPGSFQVGVMLARSVQAARVCVFDVPPQQSLDCLAALGWRGPRAQADRIIQALAPHTDHVALHVDVGDQVFPHLGIEPSYDAFPWARQPHLETPWHGLFDALEYFEVMTSAQRKALLSWVGYQSAASIDDPSAVLMRGLSHVKLVVRPDARPLAKAYFGITMRHRERGPRHDRR